MLLLVVPAVSVVAADAASVGGCVFSVPTQIITATPADYLAAVAGLVPGDLLQLAAGTYPSGLPITALNGTEGNCIVIEGPANGAPAVFTGRDCCNTVSISNSSYVVIRNLLIDGQDRLGDGVKAEGSADWAHHITLENLTIVGHGVNQQIVGISTKCPAWNWVIRCNTIDGAGTGMYLGNSNGEDEFASSLIEHNLVVDTIGYNLQVKHQNGRATDLGSPASGTTVIRHNVFSKANNGSSGGEARPNLLVGHWPLSGAGADDDYLIYGNFFHQNPDESLFQGEGNLIFYANLMLNDSGAAVRIQPHNDVPRRVQIFANTVVASATGISVSGGDPSFEQRVVGNAVFAATSLSGGSQVDNFTAGYAAAGASLKNPDGVLTGDSDRLDLSPLPGQLWHGGIDPSGLDVFEDWNRDFNGWFHAGPTFGAYVGGGHNPGWQVARECKPDVPMMADGFESGDQTGWSPNA